MIDFTNGDNKSGLLSLRILGVFFLLFAIVFYLILFLKVVNILD